jgi:hypothetical protein
MVDARLSGFAPAGKRFFEDDPSTEFTDQFWEHLSPRLTRLCVALARCVAAQVETFDGAWNTLMHYAIRYGARHLPKHQQQGLEDWLTVQLSEAIFAAEEEGGWTSWLKDNRINGGRAP